MSTDSMIERAKSVVHPNLDIKTLIKYYNLYTSPHWQLYEADWCNACLSLVKEQLFQRGVVRKFPFDRLENEPNVDTYSLMEGLVVRINEQMNTFEIVQDDYDLENDILSCDELKTYVQDDQNAINLYRSLSNVEWVKNGIPYGCSWRHAGGIVADLRDRGEDYMSFYCSGGEGEPDETVSEILGKLGWFVFLWESPND